MLYTWNQYNTVYQPCFNKKKNKPKPLQIKKSWAEKNKRQKPFLAKDSLNMTIKARCQIMFTKAQELFCKQDGIIMIIDYA